MSLTPEQENARHKDGTFGTVERSAPDVALGSGHTAKEAYDAAYARMDVTASDAYRAELAHAAEQMNLARAEAKLIAPADAVRIRFAWDDGAEASLVFVGYENADGEDVTEDYPDWTRIDGFVEDSQASAYFDAHETDENGNTTFLLDITDTKAPRGDEDARRHARDVSHSHITPTYVAGALAGGLDPDLVARLDYKNLADFSNAMDAALAKAAEDFLRGLDQH